MVDVQVSKITVTIGKKIIRFSTEDAIELHEKLEDVLYPGQTTLRQEYRKNPEDSNNNAWFNKMGQGIKDLNAEDDDIKVIEDINEKTDIR